MTSEVDLHAQRAQERRSVRRSARWRADAWTYVIAGVAVILAVLSDGHPTGYTVLDALYRAVFAAVVVLAASRARRWACLVLAGVTLAASRGWWFIPAGIAAITAFVSTFQERRRRRIGALVGAASVWPLLNLRPFGFFGSTALVTAVATIPVLVSGYRHTSTRFRRIWRWGVGAAAVVAVVCSIPILATTAIARNKAAAGISATHAAFDAATNGDQQRSLVLLDSAEHDFADANRLVGSPVTALADVVPVLSQHRRALAGSVRLAHTVAGGAAVTTIQADYGTLRYHVGHIDTAHVAAMEQPLTRFAATLADAQKRVRSFHSDWLVAPIDNRVVSLQREIDKVLPETRLAVAATKVAPALLGANGPRHYLVAFMTPAEQRGLGGFIGAWGELQANNGHLDLIRNGNSGDWTNAAPRGVRKLLGPPDYIATWGSSSAADAPQDSTFSADYPEVAQVLSQLYPQSGGEPIDGVLTLDPYALAALLRFTGPIHVAGSPTPLTEANAANYLVYGQYLLFPSSGTGPTSQASRHDSLQDALRTAFDILTKGSLPGPRGLADQLSPVAHQDRLMFWSPRSDEENLATRIGIDGVLPAQPGQDLLAVTTQNVAHSKIDVFLKRRIAYNVTFDPTSGSTSATATVTLTNTAPATGLPPSITGNTSAYPPGTNATFLSIYSPLLTQNATLDGQRIPQYGGTTKGEHVTSASVVIPPGATRTVTFQLFGTLAPRAAYRLQMRPQPMVTADQVNVQVTPARGIGITGVQGGSVVDGRATVGGVFRTNHTLVVRTGTH